MCVCMRNENSIRFRNTRCLGYIYVRQTERTQTMNIKTQKQNPDTGCAAHVAFVPKCIDISLP